MVEDTRVAVLSADGMPEGLERRVAELAERLGAGVALTVCTEDELRRELTRNDVLLLWDFFSRAVEPSWSEDATVRWIHVPAAGVDKMLFGGLIDADTVVTNARGIFDRPISEYVLGMILRYYKQFGLTQDLARRREWRHREPRTLEGSSVLVVGTGPIGRCTARLLRAVGMEVTGSGRRHLDSDPDFGPVLATEELPGRIGEFDVVVLVAPLTDTTRGMMSEELLGQMAQGSYLINVGRGELLDTSALEKVLRSGEGPLGGAGLDVFETEPLPPDSPLWTVPNLFISPHMSGDDLGWRDRLRDQFLANLERWLSGQPLVNVVDKERGYVPVVTR
ncbi:D-2-hydroxyacid dehydrogenase [Acidipropionibacterium jensenii]|uniref:D-2-hydroxyacid dehydrogenase n=1 Tax=Acidipropionibacterium jensenii TaxID=1749 RepID=A0A3Q9UCE4_9ACTN|nr:D-2-hydroxyacid dehydrogenase [Acidipropionibacterium jensenii]AZZ38558.1 D-2-hydroxyacid dehydrogenase [Acidipropionibacterium jensenii]